MIAHEASIEHGPIAVLADVPIDYAGYVVALFIVTWSVALAVWRLGRIEQRWVPRAAHLDDFAIRREVDRP